jgi:hypothetical protein
MVLKFGFSEVKDSTKVYSETSVYLHDMVIINTREMSPVPLPLDLSIQYTIEV